MSVKELTHDSIVIDGGTQARHEINYFAVIEYKELYETGVEFPPLVVFTDGATNWLASGFHRYHASKDAGLVTVPCDVRKGTLRDAIRFAIADNQQHGLRRTNMDKRKAVEMALADTEWGKMSDVVVAEKVGVGHAFVSKVRLELSTVEGSKAEKAEAKRTGKDGKKRKAPKARTPSQPKTEPRSTVAFDDEPSPKKERDVLCRARKTIDGLSPKELPIIVAMLNVYDEMDESERWQFYVMIDMRIKDAA